MKKTITADELIDRLAGALLVVLNSALLSGPDHDWKTCKEPSCTIARVALEDLKNYYEQV